MAKKIQVFTVEDETARPRHKVLFDDINELFDHLKEEVLLTLKVGDKIKIEFGVEMITEKEFAKLPDVND